MTNSSIITLKRVLIPCLLTASAWAQASLSFNAPPRDYAVPSTPETAVAGDFNGDGNLDIATIGDFGISVLPGKGNGSFGTAIYTSLADGGYGPLVAGDFNRDGILDLASIGQLPDGIVVFLGKGNGRFTPQPVIPISAASFNLITADLNGDGNLDLITAVNGQVNILLGKGDGTFAAATKIAVTNAETVQVGDFNKDGKPDLAVSTGSIKNLVILPGNGDGTFRTGSTYSIDNFTGNFAVGDVNNDGNPDVIGAGPEAAVLLGNGDGTLQQPTYVQAGATVNSLVLADFNHDGNLDLAILTNIQSVAILLGNGQGGFTKTSSATMGYGPTQLAVGDFNGDGRPDLAAAENSTPYASVLLTGPGGKIEAAPSYDSGIPAEPVAAIVVDLNHDDKPDVVTVQNSSSVSILLGTGSGAAPLQTAVNIALPAASAVAVASGDFNRDGNADLAVADQLNGVVYILLGHGDGTFTSGVTLNAGSQPGSIAIGDFNGDGKTDLAVGDEYSSSVLVFIGNGDGTFQPSATYLVPNAATDVAAGDFNGDGRSDLIVAEGNQSTTPGGGVILIANADGTFQPAVTITNESLFYQAVVGDVNGDGKLDVIFRGLGGSGYELLGNGDGTFGAVKFITANPESLDFSLVDLNGDGKLDLVSAGYASNAFSVLLGEGTGKFSREIVYGAGQGPRVVVGADFNGDGKPDLISLQYDNYDGPKGTLVKSSTYTVLLNTTP